MEHGWIWSLPTLAVLLYSSSLVDAHSWVEQLTVVAPDGRFTGAKGYPRGNVFRSPGFNDQMMQWQLPTNLLSQLNETMPMCRPSQRAYNYTTDSPALKAAPGDVIAMRYQENGHVTQPWIKSGKPEHSGTVYVYGTENPSPEDTLMGIHQKWTLDGKGGDGRGRLLSTQYFDDGQCYQISESIISVNRQKEFPRQAEAGSVEGANLWCQTDIALPMEASPNTKYTLYWVWDWSTLDTANSTYQPELYTTCIDIDVIASGSQGSSAAVKNQNVPFVKITNYGEAAIQYIFENLRTLGTQTVTPQTAISSLAAATGVTTGAPAATTTAPLSSGAAGQPGEVSPNCGSPVTVTVTAPAMPATTTTVTITTTAPLPSATTSSQAVRRFRRGMFTA